MGLIYYGILCLALSVVNAALLLTSEDPWYVDVAFAVVLIVCAFTAGCAISVDRTMKGWEMIEDYLRRSEMYYQREEEMIEALREEAKKEREEGQ